jgi:hypothetical protein
MASDRTRDEVELIVAGYFAMLEAELSGHPVNKAGHNRRLQEQIGRSKGSIEFKPFNISAVLLDLGDLPYIGGTKPRRTYQQQLELAVLERLSIEPDFFGRLASSPAVSREGDAGRLQSARRARRGPARAAR